MSAAAQLGSLVGLPREAKATIEEAADMAHVVFGGGGLARIAGLIRAHDWGGLVDLGIRDIAACIAIADPPLATLAPLAATLIIYARHRPEAIDSPAMQKAAGAGNVVGA